MKFFISSHKIWVGGKCFIDGAMLDAKPHPQILQDFQPNAVEISKQALGDENSIRFGSYLLIMEYVSPVDHRK